MNKARGFTLVELMVMVALVGILGTMIVAIVNPIAQLDKANDAKRKADLAQVQKALDLYYEDNGQYPLSTGNYQITNAAWGASWTPYIARLPQDPSTNRRYVYFASNDGQAYWLYANLARGANDPQSCQGGTDCPNVPAGNACGNSPCNYGVSSSNVSP